MLCTVVIVSSLVTVWSPEIDEDFQKLVIFLLLGWYWASDILAYRLQFLTEPYRIWFWI